MIHNVIVKHYKMADKVEIPDSKQVNQFTHEFDIRITKGYCKVNQNMKKSWSDGMLCFPPLHLFQFSFEPFHHSITKVDESKYGVGSGFLIGVF